MKIGIVGLGLMGGSLGRALVARTTHTVYACDRDPEAMLKGGMLNAYHEELTRENARGLDIFLMAVVPSAMPDILKEYLPLLKSGGIVSDLAGVKRPVVAMMKECASLRPDLGFVGGHPMAGREFSGVAHSTAGLYDGASVLLRARLRLPRSSRRPQTDVRLRGRRRRAHHGRGHPRRDDSLHLPARARHLLGLCQDSLCGQALRLFGGQLPRHDQSGRA